MTEQTELVRLGLNNLAFQRSLFDLSKEDQRSVLATLKKLSNISWNQIYQGPSASSSRAPQGATG